MFLRIHADSALAKNFSSRDPTARRTQTSLNCSAISGSRLSHLTGTMLSGKVRKSYEGKVGAIFEEHNVFVTTPNQSTIPSPLRGERRIWLRRDFHFGEEDPCYHPQPFSDRVPHLSVIPFPSADPTHKHAIAFRVITVQDFIPTNPQDPSCNVGRLSVEVLSAMKTAAKDLQQKVSSVSDVLDKRDLEAWKNDKYTRSYVFALKCLVARTSFLSSFREAAMTFTLCQRVYLELVGRVSWFRDYLPLMREPRLAPSRVADVVGALVGDNVTCETLFLAGIPVWFVRPLDRKEGVRVDEWIQVTSPTDFLPLRNTGLTLSLADASPPYPVIYEGQISISKYDHYARMGEFLREFSTTNVFIDKTLATTTLSTSHQPSSGPSRQEKSYQKARNQKQQLPKNAPSSSSNSQQRRNKFVDVDSDLMPRSLPAWKDACEAIGNCFTDSMPSLPGLADGYAVPDPNIIVGTSNESAKVRYVTTTMKLFPLLLYRLRSPTFKPFRTREWRSVVGMEAHPSKPGTKTDERRTSMSQMLKECLISGKMEGRFDIDNLDSVVVEWNGQRFDQLTMPPQWVVREFLCELFEINFRYELVALDRHVHTMNASNGEREQEVLGTISHFNSSLIPKSSAAGREGFASDNINMRRVALLGLFTVMEGWSGGKRPMPRPLVEGVSMLKPWEREVTELELEHYEKGLVHHYISSFASVFGRAPLLPHRL